MEVQSYHFIHILPHNLTLIKIWSKKNIFFSTCKRQSNNNNNKWLNLPKMDYWIVANVLTMFGQVFGSSQLCLGNSKFKFRYFNQPRSSISHATFHYNCCFIVTIGRFSFLQAMEICRQWSYNYLSPFGLFNWLSGSVLEWIRLQKRVFYSFVSTLTMNFVYFCCKTDTAGGISGTTNVYSKAEEKGAQFGGKMKNGSGKAFLIRGHGGFCNQLFCNSICLVVLFMVRLAYIFGFEVYVEHSLSLEEYSVQSIGFFADFVSKYIKTCFFKINFFLCMNKYWNKPPKTHHIWLLRLTQQEKLALDILNLIYTQEITHLLHFEKRLKNRN